MPSKVTDATIQATATSDPPVWRADVRGKWPTIALDEAGFRAHLARLGRSAPVFPIDTYLAAACTAGDPAAIRILDDELVSTVPIAIRRIDASTAFAAEIAQQLRVRLLVSEPGELPRIARYTGEVPLSAWIRVIALRLALNAKRVRSSEAGAEIADSAIADPEVDYLRAQYREPFVRAFHHALESTPRDDRTILRLHYLDGVNIDGIGRIFQLHRATIARRLVRIRADVLARAKVQLAAELGTELDEAASVIGALAGELDVTLSRLLATR
jgi:RNA polymerase sigma-70 factor, ECF subfamily